ncbi:expressed unknown protein [Seminavis robusta]|uniref:Helicase-associated domain-containing protein n=1 Tax=Seminavis robusta TaxID=568900 RepID=A0A9N8HE68_9STRA|nr:expressed unknown protein [Seminavis robusta]|eukprot:Sro391_g133080.1 n/a (1108) ;mRNA; f:30542-33865
MLEPTSITAPSPPEANPNASASAPPSEEAEEKSNKESPTMAKSALAVAGQFEDADNDDSADEGKSKSPSTVTKSDKKPSKTSTTPLAFLAEAAKHQEQATDTATTATATTNTKPSLPDMPHPSRLQRRISTNTCNATSALLEMASSSPTSSLKKVTTTTAIKKKKTFVVRLEELKEYKERHGAMMNLENPNIKEAWEQGLWTWLFECRKQYRTGQLSEEKAMALRNLGCEGFEKQPVAKKQEEEENEEAKEDVKGEKRLEARHKEEQQARQMEAHMMRERMMQQERTIMGRAHEQRLMEQAEAGQHPALRALWLKRKEEALKVQQMQAAGMIPMAPAMAAARPPASASGSGTTKRSGMDPDGTTSADADEYPAEKAPKKKDSSSSLNDMQKKQQKKKSMQAQQEARVLEEMYAREAMAREAIMREQRLAAVMAANRMGGGFGMHNATLMQQGRVMSLLQPLESVPPRADPFLGAMYHRQHPDPRVNALLQAQLLQQQEQQRSATAEMRRSSDASGSALGAAGESSNSNLNVDVAATASGMSRAKEETAAKPAKKPRKQRNRITTGTGNNNGGKGKTRKSWDQRMQQMWNFFLTYGHTKVQTRGEHKELGRWLSRVRCNMRDGLLPQHHVKEFLAMQEWTMEDNEAAAAAAAQRAKAAKKAPAPPAARPKDDGASTGSNHSSRRNSAATAVTDDAVPTELAFVGEDADAVGSLTNSPTSGGKNIKRAMPKSWDQSFLELEAFKERFGHCDVKMIGSSPFGLLGKWLASQRSRHKLGQLPEDKVKRLRSLGCADFGPMDAEGDSPNQSIYRKDPEEAEFDAAIRSKMKKVKPSDDMDEDDEEEGVPTVRAPAMLDQATSASTTPTNSAPASPNTKEKRVRHSFETRLEHIKAYKEKHGHCKARLGSEDKHEELLARWLASARSRYRAGQFKEDRAAELRTLGCDGFEPIEAGQPNAAAKEPKSPVTKKRDAPARTATPSPTPSMDSFTEEDGTEHPNKKQRTLGKRKTFEDMLKELEEYQFAFGAGCSVPKPDGDKGKLGRWLAFQRRQFIAGKLTPERVEKLKAIGRTEFEGSSTGMRLSAAHVSAAVRVAEMSAAGSATGTGTSMEQ